MRRLKNLKGVNLQIPDCNGLTLAVCICVVWCFVAIHIPLSHWMNWPDGINSLLPTYHM